LWQWTLCFVLSAATLDAEGWATASASQVDKEVFLESLVTQQLHGFVLSDGALKTYAQSAPADYNLLLLQLKTQPWLCGGTTGHPCDAPDTAPLNEQSWNNVVSGKDPNKTAVFVERLMHWRFGMEVSNKPALMEWARSPPNDFTLALQQLKGAKFMCGGTEKPCHHSFAAGDSSAQLTPEQSKAVWTGTLIFVCLCILVTVLIVIAYAMVLEDKRRSTSHDLQMQIRNSKLKYQHSLALNELAASAAPVQDKAMVPMVPFSYMTGYSPALAAGYQDVRQVVLPATASPYSGRSGVALATPSAPCSPCYTAAGAVVYSRGSASSAGPVTSKPVPQESPSEAP